MPLAAIVALARRFPGDFPGTALVDASSHLPSPLGNNAMGGRVCRLTGTRMTASAARLEIETAPAGTVIVS